MFIAKNSRNRIGAGTVSGPPPATTPAGSMMGRAHGFDTGERFGVMGPFERMTGRAHGEVDPNSPDNSIIQDIALTPRIQRGMI
jgi:hypothetical protein